MLSLCHLRFLGWCTLIQLGVWLSNPFFIPTKNHGFVKKKIKLQFSNTGCILGGLYGTRSHWQLLLSPVCLKGARRGSFISLWLPEYQRDRKYQLHWKTPPHFQKLSWESNMGDVHCNKRKHSEQYFCLYILFKIYCGLFWEITFLISSSSSFPFT